MAPAPTTPTRIGAQYRGCTPAPTAHYNRRAVRRGVVMVMVVVTALHGMPTAALAAPEVTLKAAADGTLSVVGNGWRPGQRLVVSVGADNFPARADSTGSFEVVTGLASYEGQVAVHRPDPRSSVAAQSAALGDTYVPDPLAVLFTQSMAIGVALSTLAAGGLAILTLAAR